VRFSDVRSLPILCILLLGSGLAISQTSDTGDHDYAVTLRLITDLPSVPSIRDQCDETFSAFRIVEVHGGTPIAIAYVENASDEIQLTRHRLPRGRLEDTEIVALTPEQWDTVYGLFVQSGFWAVTPRSDLWMPDGYQLWIEGCIDGEFSSVALYPEYDNRMVSTLEFLSKIPR